MGHTGSSARQHDTCFVAYTSIKKKMQAYAHSAFRGEGSSPKYSIAPVLAEQVCLHLWLCQVASILSFGYRVKPCIKGFFYSLCNLKKTEKWEPFFSESSLATRSLTDQRIAGRQYHPV